MAVCEQDRPAQDLTSVEAQLKYCEELRREGVLYVWRDRIGRISVDITLPEKTKDRELKLRAFAFLRGKNGKGFGADLEVVDKELVFLVIALDQISSQKGAVLFYPEQDSEIKNQFTPDTLEVDESLKRQVAEKVLKAINLFGAAINLGYEWRGGMVYDEMRSSTSSLAVRVIDKSPELINQIPMPRGDIDPAAKSYLAMKEILEKYLKTQTSHE